MIEFCIVVGILGLVVAICLRRSPSRVDKKYADIMAIWSSLVIVGGIAFLLYLYS